MDVHKRLVVIVQGYDPQSGAECHQWFQRECAKACALNGVSGNVEPAKDDPKRFATAWKVTTKGDGWEAETRVRLLRCDDIVGQDLARPAWWKIVQMYRTTGVAVLNGVLRRVLLANWRYGAFALLPLLLITMWILLGSFFGVLCMALVARLGAPEFVARLVGGVTGVGGFASLLWLTEPVTWLLRRCDQAATTDQYINRKHKDFEQRLNAFGRTIGDIVRASNAEEVLFVGHGLGAAFAIDVVGRALTRDPALGADGKRLTLLTLGANLPVVTLDPEAKWFRNRLRQLAGMSGLEWIDVQSPDDALSFCPFDPIAGCDIVLEADERRNPAVATVRLRDLAANGGWLRRWRFFEVHDRYLRANERLGAPYDFYMICCGPLDLATRLRHAMRRP